MHDLIERQAAIDALDKIFPADPMRNDYTQGITCGAALATEYIKQLPSAQPDIPTVDTEDLIVRGDAIEAVNKHIEQIGYDNDPYVLSIRQAVRDVPSAQPERKKGEWIDYTEDGYVECPFCHSATNCDGNKDELHFCFSCGADMRGKQDG